MLTQPQIEFVVSLYPAAKECENRWRVPVYISLGQTLHESWTPAGKPSRLALQAHNYWGIKAFKSWKGRICRLDTFEFKNGVRVVKKGIAWRKYPDDYQAFDDYGQLLNSPRYVSAFRHLAGDPALRTEEQEDKFISEIAHQWATDPNYARYVDKAEDLIQREMENIMLFSRAIILAAKATMQVLRGV